MVDIKKQDLLTAIESFYFAYREFTAGPDAILASKNLNRVHHRILYFVARHPGININELLRILQVSKQALNAPLRKLLEQGLVHSQSAAHDKRVKQLSLSKAGSNLEAELTQTQMHYLQKIFSESEREVFNQWLAVMGKASLPQ